MCPQIPSPRALCTVLCVRACSPVILFAVHTVVICGCYASCRGVPKNSANQCIKRRCIVIVRDACITMRKVCTKEFLFSTYDVPVPSGLKTAVLFH